MKKIDEFGQEYFDETCEYNMLEVQIWKNASVDNIAYIYKN